MIMTFELADATATSRRGITDRSKAGLQACRECGKHRALFRRGSVGPRVRRDRQHDLCFRCYRAALDRRRALVLREAT